MLRRIAFAMLVGCATASSAFGAAWALLDSSFVTHEVDVAAIDATGIARATPTTQSATSPSTAPARFDLDAVVELSRINPKTKPAAMFLHLVDGQRIAGGVQSLDGETLTWKGDLGTWTVDLKQIRAIGPATATQNAEVPAEDIVKLKNGDTLAGVVAGANAKKLTLQSGNDSTEIEWANVASLRLAGNASKPVGLDVPIVRVTTLDGSVLFGKSIAGDAKTWKLADLTGDGVRTVVVDKVQRVERLGGRVVWLSTLAPSEVVDRPFFPATRPREAFVDRRSTGTTASVAGTKIERSIGVRSQSKLTWAIAPGAYAQLRLRYAVPDDARSGNVTVRVLVDGKARHEQTNVVAGKQSDVVTIDLPTTASSVSLEVDYGEGYDVQDKLEWIDAALVRTGT
jgi:hypothetical protein